MSDDLNTEIKIGADASGVEAGVGRAKRSLADLGVSAKKAGKDAGDGVGSIGAGGEKAAKDVERATKSMQGSLQRLLAEQKAGAKGSREYYEALADTRGISRSAIKPILDQIDAAKSKTLQAKTAADSWTASLGKVGPLVAAAFSGAAITGFLGKVVSVQREFDVLNSSMKTVTGSSAAAEREMAWLKDFAKETPFGLAQATQGFVKMKALGLDPTRAALTSFGNTASAMGKDLNQMIEAVADASTGEFERLKEFGIKAKKEGDQVSLTFQGVTTTIQNSAADITKYLEDIGNTSFGGAMEERAKTLDGTIAALGDTWDELFRTVSTNNAGSLIFDSVTLANGALEDATNILKAMGGAAQDASRDTGALSTIQNGIATVFETVAVLGVNLKYVLVQIGNEIGGLAAQVAQAAQFNFSGVAAIRRQMVADAEAARKEIDATTERILNARKAQEEYARYATRNASAAQATLLAKQPAIKAPSARGKSESDSGLATLIRQAHDYAAALDYAAANGGQKMSQAEKQLAEALEKTGGKLSAANRALLEGNVAREKAAAVTRGATEAEAAWQKAQDESRAASEKQRDALQEQVARQRAANAEIGLTADGLAALEESRLRDAIATTRQEFALRQKDGADLNELKAIDDQIGAYEQLIALKRDGAARQAVADEARLASEEWKRFSDDIERSLTDSLMRSFESGENFGKTFVKSLQNTLKTTVLKVAVQAVVGDVMGAVGLGSGGSGSGSSIGSALSMGSNLSSLAGGGSILSGFGAGFSSMAGEMAMGANFVGPSAALASGSVGAGAATASAMGSTAAGMMSSVAAAAPYALAALAVADAVGLFGKGGGPQQGQYSQTTRDSFNVSHTSSGGAPLDSKALASAVLGQVDMLYSMAGRQKANVMIDQGYGFDPQGTSQDMKYRKINIDGRQLTSFDDRSVRGDSAGAAARLSHLTSKEIEAIAAAINDSKLNGIIETLKANFGDLAAAMEKYAVGQAKQQALLSLLQSDEEKQRDTTNSLFAAVGGVFNSLNVAMPDSVAGLHAFVAGLDLTTKSGADTLATLDALGPSLVSYIEAAKKVEADRRAWQEKLDVLNGTTTEKELERNRTLASTSDTATQALMRQVWAMEDQQAAATAAADAAKLAADALAELSARAASVKSAAYGAYAGLLSATGNEKGALEFNVSAAQEAYQQALAAVAGNAGISSAAAQGYIDANGGIASAAAKYWGELGSGMDEATIRSRELLTELVNAASGVAQAQTALKSFAEQPVVVADTVRQVVDDTARAQQQIRDEWQRTADSIFDTIRKLRGDVASPAQSYAAAQAQFSIATAAARAGDQGAAGQLPQLAQSVVDLGKAIAVTRVDQQLLTARTIASLSATMEGMRQFGIEIPAFASGGYHAGGLRLVGENGPELEATGSARIYNFEQTRDMLTGGGDMRGILQELIAVNRKLDALHADNSAENRAIASATAKTAKTLERFDDGDALTVRVSA